MALIDNRITSRKDYILGAAKGNLAFGKFMFTVYPKYAVRLRTQNLDQVLSLAHEFENSDLMRKGDKVFSVTYLLGYALTNSHHSIDYKETPNIEINDVFSNIGNIEDTKFCDLSSDDKSWAIDIAREKDYLGQKPRNSISNNRLEIGQSSRHPTLDWNAIANMSKKINRIGNQLDSLTG